MKLESAIQTEIIKWLKTLKKSFVYKHEPSPSGIPDIHCIYKGHSFWFEVKRTKNHKPTQLQIYNHNKLRKAGASVTVVWSLKQVKGIIKEFERLNLL